VIVYNVPPSGTSKEVSAVNTAPEQMRVKGVARQYHQHDDGPERI
jgi:hypothetical protein